MYIPLDDLRIYQEAMDYGEKVNAIVIDWNHFLHRELAKQWYRAADSIALNIAEGHGRHHLKENLNFLYYSRGSLLECKACTQKAMNREIITAAEFQILQDILRELHVHINNYINKISKPKQ